MSWRLLTAKLQRVGRAAWATVDDKWALCSFILEGLPLSSCLLLPGPGKADPSEGLTELVCLLLFCVFANRPGLSRLCGGMQIRWVLLSNEM